MKMKQIRLIVLMISLAFLCSCIRGGGSIKLSPDHVVLSWERQSFQLTSSDYYYVSQIRIGDTRYSIKTYDNTVDTEKTNSAEAEWVHWRHQEGEDFSTVTVDENLTGKERTARIYVFAYDIGGVLSITQRPKE